MQNDELLNPLQYRYAFPKRMRKAQGTLTRKDLSNLLSLLQHRHALAVLLVFFVLVPVCLSAQEQKQRQKQNPLPTVSVLKKLSFEELMNIEVTSVSKVPEKLTEVASAIQVITNDDIKRSASNSLAEALRLASNLQVAKPNSHEWAITARGFNAAPLRNNTLSNKLLVMIDGRSVYTPLFGGVFWDVQNVLLEDIDRIEVVSGPGGTLWGANAVNGVINIITKKAKETQGMYVTASSGTFLHEHLAARFGTRIDSNIYLRVYGQHYNQGSTKFSNGTDAHDGWALTQAGFKLDYYLSPKNTFSVHGDLYGGTEETPVNSKQSGQNITARWVHTYSPNSELVLQAYYDRTWKYLTTTDFRDLLNTYDIDLQHRFRFNKRNTILWGVGYRLMNDNTNQTSSISFVPANKNIDLLNTFIQDQVTLVPKKLEVTIGTKFLYNDYSGFEIQPSARMAWTPTSRNTLWAAVSRSVRTPSRFETDEVTAAITTPGGQFNSEKVVAYEIGYRVQPAEKLSLSLATFFNRYTDLRSINTNTNPSPSSTYIFANDQIADSWGFEISGNVIATSWWRMRAGYTFLDKKFTSTSPNVIPSASAVEALDPKHQVMFQSITNLFSHLQFDLTARYVGDIESTLPVTISVASYATFDMRLAWETKKITFSVQGQNLASADHAEFGTRQIPRSILGKISFRF